MSIGWQGGNRDRFLEQRSQGNRKALLHHHTVAVRRDHSLEFRQLAGLRAKIKRRHIQKRVLDRHDQKIATNDTRAHLVPQRDLLRNIGVLVDARLDLERTVDELVLGKLVNA